MKFKVGDKIILTSFYNDDGEPEELEDMDEDERDALQNKTVLTITGISYGTSLPIVAKFPNEHTCSFRENEI